jgi:hypothetical protein
MRRLVIAALVVAAVGGVAGSAVAANGSNGVVIYDSTPAGALPGNIPSLGPEAYAFGSLGDKITFANGPRKLSSVVVTMSSWACQQGTWFDKNCVTKPGTTFSQPITLTIWNADHTQKLASSTQTFAIPYRPSADPSHCTGSSAGKWYDAASATCFNGLASDVSLDFARKVTLPNTVEYEISYNTRDYGTNPLHVTGPYDSLNIGITDGPSVGSTDAQAWTDGAMNADANFAGTPAVQFNTARLWKVN